LLPYPGQTFAGKYTIGRVLGQGGVGVVFEAFHQRLNQRVAIKILRAEARRSSEWLARFDREARAAVKLRGPNVARVFDVDTTPDGTPYMVMELLEGWNLAEEIGARGPLPIAEAVGYLLEACSAMAEAHWLGIVHRDLTPANIFLANAGGRRMAKVVDFGISKITDERTNVTTTDAAFGTPQYVSPEQIRSTAQVDARTDVWSLSVILFESLAGMTPFEGKTASAVVAAVLIEKPKPIAQMRPDLPKGLVAAIMKGLTKNPAERFQTVDELAAAIAPFGPPGFVYGSHQPLSERPGMMTGALPMPGPPLLPSLNAATLSSPPGVETRGMFADPGRRAWIAAAIAAGSILVLTALVYGFGSSSDDGSAANPAATSAPAPAIEAVAAPQPAATPTATSSTSAGAGDGAGEKPRPKSPGGQKRATPQPTEAAPAQPKTTAPASRDANPLHL
jgi:serine/threonine-protein kinase